MAATLTNPVVIPLNTVPTVRETITQITGDASYPTGGYAVSAAQLGLSALTTTPVCTIQTAAAGAVTAVSYNLATGKVQFWTATAEVANTTNVATVVANIVAIGA